MEPKKNKIIFVPLTILVVFLFVFIIFEIGLRLFWSGRRPVPELPSGHPYFQSPYKDVNYILVPNHRYRKLKFLTNRDGFRISPSLKIEEKTDNYRIAALGDSVIFGFHTLNQDTIPYILEERLNAIGIKGYKRVQVLNFGVPGYNMIQYLAVLKEYALKYNPQFILVGITFFNDFNGFNDEYLGNGYLVPIPRHDIHGFNYEFDAPSWIVWNSYFLRMIYMKVAPKAEDLVRGPVAPKGQHRFLQKRIMASCDPEDDIWEETDQIVREFKEICESKKMGLLFLLFPTREQVIYSDVPTTPQKIFCEILKKHNLQWIDYFDAFKENYDASRIFAFKDHASHPDNIMLDFIASDIRDRIAKRKEIRDFSGFDGRINLGAGNDEKLLSFGWGKRIWRKEKKLRWINGAHARIVFPCFQKEIKSIRIRCKKFAECKKQIMSIYLNDSFINSVDLSKVNDFKTITIDLQKPISLHIYNQLDLKVTCARRKSNEKGSKLHTPTLYSACLQEIILN